MPDPDESFTAFDEVLRGRLTRKGTTHQEPRTAARAHARPSESDDANASSSHTISEEPTFLRRKKNPKTKRTALQVKSVALMSFLVDFKPQIPFTLIRSDGGNRVRRMFIDAPYYDLFFAHGAFKSSLASATDARLRLALAELIDFIEDRFKDTFTKRERSLRDGNIAFRLAWTLFAPGTLLYARQPTLAPGVAYEECGVATTSVYVEHDGPRRILSVGMQNWMFTGAQFRRVRARHHIAEFAGERRLDSTEWAVIPLDLLARDEQAAIRNRLVERGKRCVQLLSERPVRLGEYDGPVRMAWDVPSEVMNTVLRGESSWNWVVNERVVIDTNLIRVFPIPFDDADTGDDEILDLSSETPENAHLTCSDYFPGYLLSTQKEAAQVMISRLRPAEWRPESLQSIQATETNAVMALVETFSPHNRLATSMPPNPAPRTGLLFRLEGSTTNCRAFVSGIAEHARKPFVLLDLLSLVRRRSDGTVCDTPVSELQSLLAERGKWQAVVLLTNCGAVMERRSIDRSNLCEQTTRFYNLLYFYPGVLFLLTGDISDLDPLFKQLSLTNIAVGAED